MNKDKEYIIKHNTKMWKLLRSNNNITSVVLICHDGFADSIGLATTSHNTRLGYEPILLANGITEYLHYSPMTKEQFEERYLIPFEIKEED